MCSACWSQSRLYREKKSHFTFERKHFTFYIWKKKSHFTFERKHFTFYISKKTFHILPPIKCEKYLQVRVIVVPERKETFKRQINLWELPPIADKVLLAENGPIWTDKPSLSSFRFAHVEYLVPGSRYEIEMKTSKPDIWPFGPCKYQVNMAELKKIFSTNRARQSVT